jgi:phosphotransferase system  glucose/maltose/N-acetylglucosamine-specific IIC component
MKLNLFRNTNGNFDLARIIGAKAAIVYPATVGWTAYKAHAGVEPSAFGTGYALVLAAIGGLISVKEVAVAKANQTNAQTAAIAAATPPATD